MLSVLALTGQACPAREETSIHLVMTSRTVDIKLSFEQYDCTPGPLCRQLRQNLLQLGARTDDRGYSYLC